MDRSVRRWLLGLLVCCASAALAGCTNTKGTDKASLWPFGGSKTDHVPGLVSPPERIAAIRAAAKAAASAGADRQEQLAREMAAILAQETDPIIRQEIVRAVGGFQTPTATSILHSALKDTDADVRVAACRAWGKRRGPEAAAALGEVLLSDIDIDVRLAATRAIGQTGDPGAVAALGKALDDRDPTVQFCAIDSLRRVSGQDFGNDLGQWRQYARGEMPAPPRPLSVAERLRRVF